MLQFILISLVLRAQPQNFDMASGRLVLRVVQDLPPNVVSIQAPADCGEVPPVAADASVTRIGPSASACAKRASVVIFVSPHSAVRVNLTTGSVLIDGDPAIIDLFSGLDFQIGYKKPYPGDQTRSGNMLFVHVHRGTIAFAQPARPTAANR